MSSIDRDGDSGDNCVADAYFRATVTDSLVDGEWGRGRERMGMEKDLEHRDGKDGEEYKKFPQD